MDRRRRTSARGGRGFAPLLGERRKTRDLRSRRSSTHGHRRRVVHRSRGGRTGGGRSQCFLSRRAAQARHPAQGGWLPPAGEILAGSSRADSRAALGDRRDNLRRRRRFPRYRRLSGRSRRDVLAPRPAAVALALDADGVSPRDVRAAQRAHHLADQLPGRRDRHPAGHLSARQIRRCGLRRQSGWRLGFARTRRA